MQKAVFLDRDGVLFKPVIRNGVPRPPFSRREFEAESGLVPDALSAVTMLKNASLLAILVSNQPDLVYKNIGREDFDWIHAHIATLGLDDEYICFHGRDDGCSCKKPKPGMLFDAAKKWSIDLKKSFIIGDTESDMGAGRAAGVTTVLVDAPYNARVQSDFRAQTLIEAAELILE